MRTKASPKRKDKMGKIFRTSLILVTIMLSFYGVSFGDQLLVGISPTDSLNELLYGQWILRQQGGPPFSLPEKAGSGYSLYVVKPSKAIQNQEFSLNQEIAFTMQSPDITEIQKKDLSRFDNTQLSKGKSSNYFWIIPLTKTNLDPSLKLIPSLSVAQYEEENPLTWTLEKFKETDIFKSLSILLELKLNF
jgi:hypothetical protein